MESTEKGIEPYIEVDGWYACCSNCNYEVDYKQIRCSHCNQLQDWSWLNEDGELINKLPFTMTLENDCVTVHYNC